MIKTRCRNEKGAALITALLTAALVSILAMAMISRQEMDIRRTATVIHGDQAQLYARAVETWATYLLSRNTGGNQLDYLGRPLPPMMIEGGHVTGQADDLQGLFNLNNLVIGDVDRQAHHLQQFRRLLDACGINPDFAEAAADWLDDDQVLRFGGAEDREYLNQQIPYRTADRPMVSPSELDLVLGFAGEAYEDCLRPLVTALPKETNLNINTAPARLLASLANGISLLDAEQMVSARPAAGWTLADFVALPALAGTGIQGQFLAVNSDFFMLQSEAVVGQNLVTFYSLIERQGQSVQVLRRSLGSL
jgi:general secretion pathway protein K